MTTGKIKQQALKEAITIGENLIQNCESDDHGIYWKTLSFTESVDGKGGFNKIIGENIYEGVSGIILYLLALYKATGRKDFKLAVHNGARWLINYIHNNEDENYSFICGRTGSAYVLHQISICLADNELQDKSLNIARGAISFIRNKGTRMEYLNGLAGTVWGLLLIHNNTPRDWLLTYIKEAISILINNIRIYKKGIYWDRTYYESRALCGFSHGTSGISALFMELSVYFNNPLYKAIAKRGFQYENYFFDQERGQWPDFRKPAFREVDLIENELQYQQKNWEHFERNMEISAWCHGNIGISLAQIRANELDRSLLSLRNTKHASNKHIERQHELSDQRLLTFTLCHGEGGNMELLLAPFNTIGIKKAKKYLNNMVLNLLATKKRGLIYRPGHNAATEEDASLFLGNSGIGYFLLRYVNAAETPSILYPSIEGRNSGGTLQPEKESRPQDLLLLIFQKCFNKTASIMRNVNFNDNELLYGLDETSSAIDIYSSLRKIIKNDPRCNSLIERLLAWLRFEYYKIKLDESSNNFLIFTRWSYLNKINNQIISNIYNYSFKVNEGVKAFQLTNFDSFFRKDNSLLTDHLLIIPRYYGIEEIKISSIAMVLIKKIDGKTSTIDLINSMLKLFKQEELIQKKNEIILELENIIKFLILNQYIVSTT